MPVDCSCRQVEDQFRFIEQFSHCFSDHRHPDLLEHSVLDLLQQRLFGLCLGYEDLFAGEHLMAWCEANGVDYLFGLATNRRLLEALAAPLEQAGQQFQQTGQPARCFQEFTYGTRDSWSRPRRVAGKAEHLAKGANPRFVVTSLSPEAYTAQTLYEQAYCARGDRENRIKEQQLLLFADRVSCSTLRANQLRLSLATVAYVLRRALRPHGLAETELASAQCDTIRVKLLKLGAVIRVSVRRVLVTLSQGYPWAELFRRVQEKLQSLRVAPRPAGVNTG